MNSVIDAIRNTVSISLFNKGQAGKIFEDVKKTGAKVVIKNNKAECVLLSPQEYEALIDEIEDSRLLAEANSRLENLDYSTLIPEEEVYKDLGITPSDLMVSEEVEI